MRPIITRIHRRCIVKYFGSCKNLILWVLSIVVTVFILDNFIFSKGSSVKKTVINGEVQIDIKANEDSIKIQSTNVSCSLTCLDGQYPYYIKSGLNRDGPPFVCFNGNIAFSAVLKNGRRGLNLVTINDKTLNIETVKSFDTYEDDVIFQRFLKLGIPKNHVIILASFDEASLHLSQESKTLIGLYGSTLIKEIGFRDSFVMIGQKYLIPPSKAVEQLVKRNDGEMYAAEAIIQGCINIPLGKRKSADDNEVQNEISSDVIIEDKVILGDNFINCGLSNNCPKDHFPVRMYTGKKNTELPKICFKGRYVVAQDLNDAGRGVIVVVVNIESGAILNVKRFDTYESRENSAKLVNLLKLVSSSEFIIAIAHDEAQTALSDEAKNILTSFGSSFISKLGFRDVWVFVGKPNFSGFSPYEDIELGGKDTWPFSIDAKFCLNKKFNGNMTKLNLSLRKNLEKRGFCRKYDGYEEFCSEASVDVYPVPRSQSEPSMNNHPIYDVPIIVIPGLSQVATMKQLESLYQIPGLKFNVVNVMYDEKFEETKDLSALFNITAVRLKSSSKYIDLMISSLKSVWINFPTAKYVIMLEEEVIPNTDFLWYLGQCMDVFEEDESLVAVSSFNENGFKEVSSQYSIVHRGVSFPGLGVMLKKSFYDEYLSKNVEKCCIDRSWFEWTLPPDKEVLFPDVSRVTRRIYLGLTEHAQFIREYFNRPRFYSNGNFVKLDDLPKMNKLLYFSYYGELIKKASLILTEDLISCIHSKTPPNLFKGTNVAYFEQTSKTDFFLFNKLFVCFNLLFVDDPMVRVRGLHDSSIRFFVGENAVILVGSQSKYYKFKPVNYVPVTKSSLTP